MKIGPGIAFVLLVAAVFAGLILFSSTHSDNNSGASIEYQRLVNSSAGDSEWDVTFSGLIHTKDEWISAGLPPDEVPSIDFDKQMLIVAADGLKGTTGHSIDIKSVSRDGDRLRVDITKRSPGDGCMTGQMVTYPRVVVQLEKSDLLAEFKVKETKTNC